jgi:hypothetical protein
MGKISIDDRHAGPYRAFLEDKIREHEREIQRLQEALCALDGELVSTKPAEPVATPVMTIEPTAAPSPDPKSPVMTKSGKLKRKPGRASRTGLPVRPAGTPPARLNFPPARVTTVTPQG